MSILQALILGLVQGMTEFFPVSSSGHLVLVPFVLGFDEPTVAFNVAVHLGTLLAVVRVFWPEVMTLVRTVFGWSRAPQQERRLVTFIAIGSVPAALVGALLASSIDEAFERPVLVSLLMGVVGMVMMSTETRVAAREDPPRAFEQMGIRDAVGMGVAQAVAILPGVSRSGSTILAGLHLGLSRPAAARFSFLLAIPIILGATLVSLPDMLSQGLAGSGAAFGIGIATAAVSGFIAIRSFLGFVARRSLRPFGIYLVLAMVAGLLTALARG